PDRGELRRAIVEREDLGRAHEGEIEWVEEKHEVLALVVRQGHVLECSVDERLAAEVRGGLLHVCGHQPSLLKIGIVPGSCLMYGERRPEATPTMVTERAASPGSGRPWPARTRRGSSPAGRCAATRRRRLRAAPARRS